MAIPCPAWDIPSVRQHFYGKPEELTPEQLDPLIRRAVFGINESGWVWTAESCQGHPDETRWQPWADNVQPMLRLVCRHPDLGRMLHLLIDSLFVNDELGELGLTTPLGCRLYPRESDPDWAVVLVYVPASTAYHRNLGITAFERFAERLLGAVRART